MKRRNHSKKGYTKTLRSKSLSSLPQKMGGQRGKKKKEKIEQNQTQKKGGQKLS
jgi:hypothetical protein